MSNRFIPSIISAIESIKPEITFTVEEGLFEGGLLDSFDLLRMINELENNLDIDLPIEEITPERFYSVQSIADFISEL